MKHWLRTHGGIPRFYVQTTKMFVRFVVIASKTTRETIIVRSYLFSNNGVCVSDVARMLRYLPEDVQSRLKIEFHVVRHSTLKHLECWDPSVREAIITPKNVSILSRLGCKVCDSVDFARFCECNACVDFMVCQRCEMCSNGCGRRLCTSQKIAFCEGCAKTKYPSKRGVCETCTTQRHDCVSTNCSTITCQSCKRLCSRCETTYCAPHGHYNPKTGVYDCPRLSCVNLFTSRW